MIQITSHEMLEILNVPATQVDSHNDSEYIWGDTSNQSKINFISSLVKTRFHNKSILEFGTYRGSTTDKIASHLSSGRVCTVDCGYDELEKLLQEESKEHNNKIKYSFYEVGEIYKKNNRGNVDQIIGNTNNKPIIDQIINNGPYDLIYIDAAHTYKGVKNDTDISFSCISQGGIIIWDDYNSHWTGVNNFLNDLSEQRDLYYLQDNRFVVYFNMETE